MNNNNTRRLAIEIMAGVVHTAYALEVASILEHGDFLSAVSEASIPQHGAERSRRTRINRLKTEAAMRAAATRAYTR